MTLSRRRFLLASAAASVVAPAAAEAAERHLANRAAAIAADDGVALWSIEHPWTVAIDTGSMDSAAVFWMGRTGFYAMTSRGLVNLEARMDLNEDALEHVEIEIGDDHLRDIMRPRLQRSFSRPTI
jgi:hypothetical protein